MRGVPGDLRDSYTTYLPPLEKNKTQVKSVQTRESNLFNQSLRLLVVRVERRSSVVTVSLHTFSF